MYYKRIGLTWAEPIEIDHIGKGCAMQPVAAYTCPGSSVINLIDACYVLVDPVLDPERVAGHAVGLDPTKKQTSLADLLHKYRVEAEVKTNHREYTKAVDVYALNKPTAIAFARDIWSGNNHLFHVRAHRIDEIEYPRWATVL